MYVLFGTNRRLREGGGPIEFSEDRTDTLSLGIAAVTIPRAYRKKGEILVPSWRDLLSARNPWNEDPSRHFTILQRASRVFATRDDFVAYARSLFAATAKRHEHAIVFVHGYNVSFVNALYRTAQISYDLGIEDAGFGAPFLYSWPSGETFQNYAYDLDSSRLAVPHLKSFIELVARESGAKYVHVIAHSMGNWPALKAIEMIAAEKPGQTMFTQLMLAAPDVDVQEFIGLVGKIKDAVGGLTLYASSSDRAMIASRRVRRNFARAGDVLDGIPVIAEGLDSIDVSAISSEILSLNHSAYADKKELLNDMWRIMRTGERPPHDRSINMQPQRRKDSIYWKYVN